MVSSRRRLPFVAVVLLAVAALWLPACALQPTVDKTYTIAVIAPESGAEAAIGRSVQSAVDLAVGQNATLGQGYSLEVRHIDEASGTAAESIQSLASDSHLLGVIGPITSATALSVIPIIEQNGIPTISPTAGLPGLTQQTQASADGVSFSRLYPKGKAQAFFRLTAPDTAVGKAAADLAVEPAQSHGMAAQSVFIVDDGSMSGKASAAAFSEELSAQHARVGGQQTITTGPQDNAQEVVTAIIEAHPDLIFYSGGISGGALLRRTLSLTGAPTLGMLATGLIADDPGWGSSVGVTAAAAYTSALFPAQDPSKLSTASRFITAYHAAYSGEPVLPETVLAYDAAMDEITAIKSLVQSAHVPTRAGVLSAVASLKYSGASGTISFDSHGDVTSPSSFSLYTCDTKGAWTYAASLGS